MSTVRGKIFAGDNVVESLDRVNEFLEKDGVGYVGIKEISNCRLMLMYREKTKKQK